MTKTPLAVDEDLLSKFEIRDPVSGEVIDDAALDALSRGMKTARGAAEQVAAVVDALSADLTQTEAGRSMKAREIALKAGERGAQALDKAREAAAAEIVDIENSMVPEAPSDEIALQIEAQIRDRLATMDHDARAKLIAQAIRSGDDATIAAIARGPAWLAGLGDAEAAMRLDQWRRKKFPQEVERLARLKRAIGVTEIAGKSLVAFIRHIADGPTASVAAAADRAAAVVAAAEAAGGEAA